MHDDEILILELKLGRNSLERRVENVGLPGGGLLFKHAQSGRQFAVVLGIFDDVPWADIETDFKTANEDLRSIIGDYSSTYYDEYLRPVSKIHEKRRWAHLRSLDRITKPLFGGMSAKLAIKRIIADGEEGYAVEIFIVKE